MSLIIFVVLVIICIALLVWGIDLVPQLAPVGGLLKLLIIVIGVAAIAQHAGLF